MAATGVPSARVTMLTSPTAGRAAPSTANWIARVAVACLRPLTTSAASSSAIAGESPNENSVMRTVQ